MESEMCRMLRLLYGDDPRRRAREGIARLWVAFSGFDGAGMGLEALETIVTGAPGWLRDGGVVVIEIAPHQAAAALQLAAEAGFPAAKVEDDLARRPRVLVARR